MSGGYFNDNSLNVGRFAENLGEELDSLSQSPRRFSAETLKYLRSTKRLVEEAGHLAWDVERLFSGDITEKDFLERYYLIFWNLNP